MAKTSYTLSDVLAFATANNLDTSNIQACKDAYRAHMEGKEDKEEKRGYQRKTVTLCVIIPQGKKEAPKIVFHHNQVNERSQLLSLAYSTAMENLPKIKNGSDCIEKTTFFIGEEMNLMEAINTSKV